jgi:hypothetical protein
MGPSFAKTGDKIKNLWMENCTQEKKEKEKRDDQTGFLT